MTTLEAFARLARTERTAAEFWLARLEALEEDRLRAVLDNIPDSHVTPTGREFALALLQTNRERLLAWEAT